MIVEGAARLHGEKSDRIVIEGPEIELCAKAALAFSMSLHELSTNAAKYGALSSESGHVELRWSIEHDGHDAFMDLRWQE